MKKIIGMFAIVLVSIVSVTTVYAKALYNVTLYAREDRGVILNDTQSKFYTSLIASSKDSSTIKVENTVQRKINGTYKTQVQLYPIVTELNKEYYNNIGLKDSGYTRSIWVNVTNGTTIKCNLYMENGHLG